MLIFNKNLHTQCELMRRLCSKTARQFKLTVYSVSQENVDFFNTVQHAQAKMVGPKTTLKVSTRSYFLNGFFMEYGSKCLWFKGITIDFIPYFKKSYDFVYKNSSTLLKSLIVHDPLRGQTPKGAVNLSHWADWQANGLFAHNGSNVISWLALLSRIIFWPLISGLWG